MILKKSKNDIHIINSYLIDETEYLLKVLKE